MSNKEIKFYLNSPIYDTNKNVVSNNGNFNISKNKLNICKNTPNICWINNIDNVNQYIIKANLQLEENSVNYKLISIDYNDSNYLLTDDNDNDNNINLNCINIEQLFHNCIYIIYGNLIINNTINNTIDNTIFKKLFNNEKLFFYIIDDNNIISNKQKIINNQSSTNNKISDSLLLSTINIQKIVEQNYNIIVTPNDTEQSNKLKYEINKYHPLKLLYNNYNNFDNIYNISKQIKQHRIDFNYKEIEQFNDNNRHLLTTNKPYKNNYINLSDEVIYNLLSGYDHNIDIFRSAPTISASIFIIMRSIINILQTNNIFVIEKIVNNADIYVLDINKKFFFNNLLSYTKNDIVNYIYYNKLLDIITTNIDTNISLTEKFTKILTTLKQNIYTRNNINNSFNEQNTRFNEQNGCFTGDKKNKNILENILNIELPEQFINIINNRFHWTMYIKKNQNIYYFDSLLNDIPNEITNNYLTSSCNVINVTQKYNFTKQSFDICGMYPVWFSLNYILNFNNIKDDNGDIIFNNIKENLDITSVYIDFLAKLLMI